MKKGFTLVEMLVVIGIIAVLMSASMVGYSKFIKTAESTKTSELLANVTTALTALYQQEGMWPKRLVVGAKKSPPYLDADAALALARKKMMSLDTDNDGDPSQATKLEGYDKFGILTPEGVKFMKKYGKKADRTAVEGAMLRYAIDFDGDGITVVNDTELGFAGLEVRATACVWCIGGQSWSKGQEVRQ